MDKRASIGGVIYLCGCIVLGMAMFPCVAAISKQKAPHEAGLLGFSFRHALSGAKFPFMVGS